MSEKLQSYLLSLGVATSRITPYNPRGNSQCEKIQWYNLEISHARFTQ